MTNQVYDVVIIGAGPAGIQAAIHAVRRKTDVVMLGRIENSSLYAAHVENYAFCEGVREGKDLLEAGHRQARQFGAEPVPEDVLKISQEGEHFHLELESGRKIETRTIIFAMGVSKKKLGVPGEKELSGRGVSYCVDCDANFYKGATVAVIGDRIYTDMELARRIPCDFILVLSGETTKEDIAKLKEPPALVARSLAELIP